MGPMGLSMFIRGPDGRLPHQDPPASSQLQAIIQQSAGNRRCRREVRLLSGLFAGSATAPPTTFRSARWPTCWASSSWRSTTGTAAAPPSTSRQDELVACSVIARNLALVDPQFDQFVAPCAACYLNLKKTDKLMSDDPEMGAQDQRVPGGRRAELQAGPGHGAPPARRDLHRHRRGGRPRQGGPAADRAARGAVLRLPSGPARGRRRQHRVPHEDGRAVQVARRRSGRLPGQGPLLRRPHDADQRAAGLRADPPPAAQRGRVQGRPDPLHVPDVPVEHGRLPGPGQRVLQHEFQLPIIFFTQMLGVAFGLDPSKLGSARSSSRPGRCSRPSWRPRWLP